MNTSTGRVLRALLDYSLLRSRTEEQPVWEKEIEAGFELTFLNKSDDPYTITGMYFPQFYYVCREWISQKIKMYEAADQEFKGAFIGGLGFSAAVSTKDAYTLLYPHYTAALLAEVPPDTHNNFGIIRHIACYYLWDMESLESPSLTNLLITTSSINHVKKLIDFLWQQDRYLEQYTDDERNKIKSKVVNLWKFTIDHRREEEIAEHIIVLTGYFDSLDETNSKLLLYSTPFAKHYNSFSNILETLNRLKDTGPPIIIAEALESLEFKNHLYDEQQKIIIMLVEWLFENKQPETGESICNKLSFYGHDFLRSTYYKYKRPN
ncbi:MAG: hypothetical protein JWM28_241, partial [Chitinophagaceae bacterium]|nr:hypothetical protein [Chitinophagaceae bacterium]